jgi:hypothetical protein
VRVGGFFIDETAVNTLIMTPPFIGGACVIGCYRHDGCAGGSDVYFTIRTRRYGRRVEEMFLCSMWRLPRYVTGSDVQVKL